MTLAQQANLILDALKQWVANNKGRTFVAADPLDVIDELRSKPGAPTAAVLWFDEEPWGNYPELGKVLRTFKIIISRGRGMKLVSGESLTEGVAGGPPLLDLVEQAREVARRLRVEEDGELQLPVYKGTGPFEVNGFVLDAVEIRFGLFAQNPRQENEPAQTTEETT